MTDPETMIDPDGRILHLFANFKWTGPADPAIRTADHLRRLGCDLHFGQAAWTLPGAEHRMAIELWRCAMPVLAGLELRKHFRPLSVLRDAAELERRIEDMRYRVVHAHLLGDHLLAALTVRRVRRRTGDAPLLVRSLYEPVPPRRDWRHRFAFRHTDGVVAPTAAVADGVVERFSLRREQVLFQDPPAERGRLRLRGDLRARWGLGPEDLLVGITARVQEHRRFDLLWEVAARVVEREPRARFVLLGRGNETDFRTFVLDPVRRLGLDGAVVLPGYLYEPDYSLALRALDVFLFLVPGSDGTCRAVREAMALGLPVVATSRGMLPSMLRADPVDPDSAPAGVLCEEHPAALAEAVLALLRDRQRRARLGRAAAERARVHMDPERAARRLVQFYGSLLREGGHRAASA